MVHVFNWCFKPMSSSDNDVKFEMDKDKSTYIYMDEAKIIILNLNTDQSRYIFILDKYSKKIIFLNWLGLNSFKIPWF